jgi:hypothetical protein
VGHPKPNDVAGSPDEAVLRMGWYANQACNELSTLHDWNDLHKTGEIMISASVPGENSRLFALPEDFETFIDDTQWDRSTQLPAIGPVNPQDWQWLVVREALITTRFMWRLRLNQLEVKSPPETPTPFVFEYTSKFWARAPDSTEKYLMSDNADYHIYPFQLPILLTRQKWLKNEGYDDTQAKKDFEQAMAHETGSNIGATALSLVPGIGYPYITVNRNLPDTGYGAP